MNIYQRYLSRFLIFLSSFFIISILFLESNTGFKWLFNFTNRLLLGLQIEEISGNWRDFTLKNINFDIAGMSVKADNIHLSVNPKSFFSIPIVFKKIEIRNLTVLLKNKTEKFLNNNNLRNTLTKHLFFKYPIIFQKIYCNKIFFQIKKSSIFVLNISTKIHLIRNNIVFFPTYIKSINIESLDSKLKNNFNKYLLISKKTTFRKKKIHDLLCSFFNKKNFFSLLNINIQLIKCKHINFINHKKYNLSKFILSINIQKNILNIKKIKVNSSFFDIELDGKIIVNNLSVISYTIRNKILFPKYHRNTINILLQGKIDHKFTFRLLFSDLFNIKIDGAIELDTIDHLFYINLRSNHLVFSFQKRIIVELKDLIGVIKGEINNYSLSLHNILKIQKLPSLFFDIKGKGNLRNIFLQKINYHFLEQKLLHPKIITRQNNIQSYLKASKLIGNINIVNNSNHQKYNVSIPTLDLSGNFMKKKFSILGSLYYKNSDFLDIPGINFASGENRIYLNGCIGKQMNIHSSMNINNLNDFYPKFKGRIKSILSMNGSYNSPNIFSKIFANNLKLHNIFLKKIELYTRVKNSDKPSGYILANAKNISISKFHIDVLKFYADWNNKKQNFFVLFKHKQSYIKLSLNGVFNHKTGSWHGMFKKIQIKTLWGNWIVKKRPFFNFYGIKNKLDNFYKKNIENIFSCIFNKSLNSGFNLINQSSINIIKELSFNTNLKLILESNLSKIRMLLIASNIKLETKTKYKRVSKNIECIKLFANLNKNNLKTKLTVKLSKKLLAPDNLTSYVNIKNIYKPTTIKGTVVFLNFPLSFLNFFDTSLKKVFGTVNGNIQLCGRFYQPKILADIFFENLSIQGDHLLKYMHLFCHSFLNKIENIKINQEIFIKNGSILFTLNPFLIKKKDSYIEWDLLFNSDKIIFVILPEIKLKTSSKLNLHYYLLKYDLIGYMKSILFHFKINEKNFTI